LPGFGIIPFVEKLSNNIAQTQVIEAPLREFESREHKIFLAGGITNCPDWQKDLIDRLQGIPNLTILNPRRKEFPIHDPNAAREQIKWEYDFLKDADMIVVWFSRGSLNPIVLYELGRWVNSRPKIPAFVGIDPEYTRAQDVMIQTELSRPDIEIVSSLEALANQVRKYLKRSRIEL
jgi:hypothetical protein